MYEIGSNSQHFLEGIHAFFFYSHQPLIQTSPTNQSNKNIYDTRMGNYHRTEAEFLKPIDTFCQVRGPIGRSATEGRLLTRP